MPPSKGEGSIISEGQTPSAHCAKKPPGLRAFAAQGQEVVAAPSRANQGSGDSGTLPSIQASRVPLPLRPPVLLRMTTWCHCPSCKYCVEARPVPLAVAMTSAPWAFSNGIFPAFKDGEPLSDRFPKPGNCQGGGSRGLEHGRSTPGPMLWPTNDGQINFGMGDWVLWDEAMDFLGLDDMIDSIYTPTWGRYNHDLRPVVERLGDASQTFSKWEIFHGLAELRWQAPHDDLRRHGVGRIIQKQVEDQTWIIPEQIAL